METVLEQQRRYHEERERLINELTKEMMFQGTTVGLFCRWSASLFQHKEKLNSELRLRIMYDVSETDICFTLQRYLDLTRDLRDMYEDRDGWVSLIMFFSF